MSEADLPELKQEIPQAPTKVPISSRECSKRARLVEQLLSAEGWDAQGGTPERPHDVDDVQWKKVKKKGIK